MDTKNIYLFIIDILIIVYMYIYGKRSENLIILSLIQTSILYLKIQCI